MTTPLFSAQQLRRLTIDDLKGRLRNKLGGIVRRVGSINPGNRVFRGVKWDERPNQISQLSYPPIDCSHLGRLTRDGRSMFYSSCAGPGVFYEMRAQPGWRIAFSTWCVTEPLWMHDLGFHPDVLRQLGASAVATRPWMVEPIPNETAHNRRLRKQVARAFAVDVHASTKYLYKQSVALAEFWMDHEEAYQAYPDGPKIPHAAGFVYPSLQMRGDADNVAFLPRFVHSSLRLEQVQFVLVERADPSRFACTFLTEAISSHFIDGTTIAWRNELPTEKLRRCHIALENGRWVQRDDTGTIYAVRPSDPG
jgi:hypothetical protein